MTKIIRLQLNSTEVRDAIREYCINVTGIVDSNMILTDLQVGGYGKPDIETMVLTVEFTDAGKKSVT